MEKRERLEKTFAGKKVDRVPVALWRHWPGDDQRADDLARVTIDFQKEWDWDFVKVSPASSYLVRGYGAQDAWRGDIEGAREYTNQVINAPEGWHTLPTLDPKSGMMGEHLKTVKAVRKGVGDDVPVIFTVFSPLAQAKNLAGRAELVRHIHQFPDEVAAGLQTITENTMRFIDVLKDTPIDGIYYAIQLAAYADLTEELYRTFGRTYDLQILDALPDSWWFNMAHLHGTTPILDAVSDYPVQAMNWHDRESGIGLAQGAAQLKGAACGGLGHLDAVHVGTPDEVSEQAADAIKQMGGKGLILSTGCVMMTTTPLANIRAVRKAVEAE